MLNIKELREEFEGKKIELLQQIASIEQATKELQNKTVTTEKIEKIHWLNYKREEQHKTIKELEQNLGDKIKAYYIENQDLKAYEIKNDDDYSLKAGQILFFLEKQIYGQKMNMGFLKMVQQYKTKEQIENLILNKLTRCIGDFEDNTKANEIIKGLLTYKQYVKIDFEKIYAGSLTESTK